MQAALEDVGAHRPQQPIVAWVMLAALVSVLIASAIGFAIGDEITTPEMYERHGSSGDGIFELSVAGAIAFGVALVVWLAFYFILFRKRAKLWKSLVALFAIVLVTAVIGVPVRIGTLISHYVGDEDTVEALHAEERAQRREIRARLAPSMDGMRMDQGQPPLTRVQDLIDHRTQMMDTLGKMRAYHAAINAHLQHSRDALEALDIYSSVKEDAVHYYDERLTPDSDVQRHLTATEDVLQKGIDFMSYLLDHRREWFIEEGRLAITDAAVLEEVRRRAEELDELGGELDRLQGAMGIELRDEEEAKPVETSAPAEAN
jgi:hypothetical protein